MAEHTIEDIWKAINGLCNRVTAIETKLSAHLEEVKRKRENVSYLIGIGGVTVALISVIFQVTR